MTQVTTKRYIPDNLSTKFKALGNMLDGNANAYAVIHFRDDMRAITPAEHVVEIPNEVTENFVLQELKKGRTVVLFSESNWLMQGPGRHDADFLVLRHTAPDRFEFYGARATADRSDIADCEQAGASTFPTGARVKVRDYLVAIAERVGVAYTRPGSVSDARALSLDANGIYAPIEYSVNQPWDEVPEAPVKESNPVAQSNQNSTNQENKIMSNVKTTAVAVVGKNKSAALTVAKLEAGRIAVKQVSKLVTPKLPMLVRGYADTEIGRLVIANLFNFAVTQFAPQNKNAVLVADAMLEGAMLDALQSLNVEALINDVVGKVDLSKLTGAEE